MTGLELELRYQNEFKDIIDALSKQLNAMNNLSDQQKQELVAQLITEFSKLLKNPIYSELVNLPTPEITNLAGICNTYLSDPNQTNNTVLYAFLEQLGPALPFGSITNIYTSWWRPVAQAQKNKLPPTAISNVRRTGLKDLALAIITDAVKGPFVTSLGLTGIGAPLALAISAIANPASAYFKPTKEVPKNTRTVLEMLVRIMKHRGITISSDLQTTINPPPTQKDTNDSNDPSKKPQDNDVTNWLDNMTGLVELLRTGKKAWDNFKKKT
jgi:hypothetical protein